MPARSIQMMRVAVIVALATGAASVAAADDGDDKRWAALDHEKLGPIGLGDGEAKIVHAIGKPSDKTKPEYEGATGEYTTFWTWRSAGVHAKLGGPERGPFGIAAIDISAPSKWKTVEGIGVGSTLEAVRKAYGAHLTPPADPKDPSAMWVVGSVYGGVFLTIEHDRVTGIYLGAMAF